MRRRWLGSTAAGLVGVGVLLGFVCYTTFAEPRPYYVTDIDAEQDYYYNARMAAQHLPLSVHHPGTPVQELGRLVLAAAGSGLDHTQRFMNVIYLIAALASAIAIATFIRLVVRDEPFGVSLLAVACVLGWPPFLTYLNNFGSDTFIVPVGLPALAWFWASLSQPIGRTRRSLIMSGLWLGVCLAVKMTFVPVAAAIGATALLRAWLRSSRDQPWLRRARAGLRGIAPLVGSMLLTYLIATAPIWRRLALVWRQTFQRPDVSPHGGGFLGDVVTTLRVVVTGNLLLAMVAGAVVLLVAGVVLVEIRRSAGGPGSANGGGEDEFDYVAGGVLLGILALGFVYTSAASAGIVMDYSEPGIQLRNISPTALFIPFGLACCSRWLRTRRADQAALEPWLQLALVAIAIAVVTLPVARYLGFRREFIHERMRRIEETRLRVDRLAEGSRRVAFWTGSDQDYLGAASFHFWGNYRYANNHFDRQVLAAFPTYAFLRLRNIERQNKPAGPPSPPSRYGKIGEFYRSLFRDRPYYRDLGGFYTGEAEGIQLAAMAFPDRELQEVPSMSLDDFEALVRRGFGSARLRKERIAGIDWIFLEVARPGDAPPAASP